jgi:23S rRNA (guanosine2251-2'-O)-methyltransferase
MPTPSSSSRSGDRPRGNRPSAPGSRPTYPRRPYVPGGKSAASPAPVSSRPPRRPVASTGGGPSPTSGEFLAVGRQSVLTALTTHPERVLRLVMAESRDGKEPRTGPLVEIRQLAQTHGKRVDVVPSKKLDTMVYHATPPEHLEGGDDDFGLRHQGVVAYLSPVPLVALEDWLPTQASVTQSLVVALDGVTDARNFGAILRVAEGAGVSAVIIPKHRGPIFSPGVSKTACGADQLVTVIQVTNMNQALRKIQEAGFWVVGASLAEDAQPYQKIDYSAKTVVVMGAEGKGLSQQTAKLCDFHAIIPLHGKLQSLNVTTAAAVLLFHIQGQMFPSGPVAVPSKAPENASGPDAMTAQDLEAAKFFASPD